MPTKQQGPQPFSVITKSSISLTSCPFKGSSIFFKSFFLSLAASCFFSPFRTLLFLSCKFLAFKFSCSRLNRSIPKSQALFHKSVKLHKSVSCVYEFYGRKTCHIVITLSHLSNRQFNQVIHFSFIQSIFFSSFLIEY